MIHAASGFEMAYAGYQHEQDRPADNGLFIADVTGAAYAFGAIQLAPYEREKSGLGQAIDVSLMDSMLNLLIYEMQAAQFPVPVARPTYGPLPAADGDVLIAPITPRNFELLCEATGVAELRTDPRFATIQSRSANWAQMMQLLAPWTRARTVAEVPGTLDAAGVPCARYGEPGEALASAHLQERGLFAAVRDAAGAFTGVNAPWQMSAAGSALGGRVPDVGEDTAQILREVLHCSAEEIAGLRASGAFGDPPCKAPGS